MRLVQCECVSSSGRECKGLVAVCSKSRICESLMHLWHRSSLQSDDSVAHRLYLLRLPAYVDEFIRRQAGSLYLRYPLDVLCLLVWVSFRRIA